MLVLLHACLISRCFVATILIYNTYSNIKALFNFSTSLSIVQCMFLSWFPPLSVHAMHMASRVKTGLLRGHVDQSLLLEAISALVSTQQPSQCRKFCTLFCIENNYCPKVCQFHPSRVIKFNLVLLHYIEYLIFEFRSVHLVWFVTQVKYESDKATQPT